GRAVPLSSQSGQPFEEDLHYHWSLNAEQGTAPGLWNVDVTVSRQRAPGSPHTEVSLSQMMLDPSVIGSTQDVNPVSVSGTTSTGSSGNSGNSSGSPSGSPAASGGGGAASPPRSAAGGGGGNATPRAAGGGGAAATTARAVQGTSNRGAAA